MAAPSRFPNGLTNVAKTNPMGMLGMPDPTKFHTWFDDFDDYDAAQWVVTEIDTDADTAVAVAATSADGGVLNVPCEADELDSTFLQWSGDDAATVIETWTFEAGKKLWFKARWKVTDATDTGVVMGLQITDTTPIAVTDGVFFYKADTSATCNLIVEKDSTETSTTAATIADATYVTTAFYYDGKSAIEVYVDDVKVGTSVTTNMPDDEELAISFGLINGAEGVESIDVDYILVVKERA
jgi:hypothetical protein